MRSFRTAALIDGMSSSAQCSAWRRASARGSDARSLAFVRVLQFPSHRHRTPSASSMSPFAPVFHHLVRRRLREGQAFHRHLYLAQRILRSHRSAARSIQCSSTALNKSETSIAMLLVFRHATRITRFGGSRGALRDAPAVPGCGQPSVSANRSSRGGRLVSRRAGLRAAASASSRRISRTFQCSTACGLKRIGFMAYLQRCEWCRGFGVY